MNSRRKTEATELNHDFLYLPEGLRGIGWIKLMKYDDLRIFPSFWFLYKESFFTEYMIYNGNLIYNDQLLFGRWPIPKAIPSFFMALYG